MNTIYRVTWMALFLFGGAFTLAAQTSVSEDLARADKQFNLYAYNLALRTYDQVLQKDPKNAHAIGRTADCYVQLNRPEEALPYYERALQQTDPDPQVMLRYGLALMSTGDYVGARKWFRNYSDVNKNTGEHYLAMCDFAVSNAQREAQYVARNEPLNTEAADYCAAYYGSRVVLNSARTDIQRKVSGKTSADWSGSAYNQLFVTQRNPEAGFLQKPNFLRSDLQNGYNEGPVSFSFDGRKVVFCRNNFIDGTRQIAEKGLNMSLYFADVQEDGSWTNIKAFEHNGSDYACGFPSLSADGRTLVFASNQPGGFGGWDIYVSNLGANGWTTPRNLGSPLNTPGNEVTPFYDGKTLYFSSDWHLGLGGMDVFKAELGQQDISAIYHLGPVINSSRDDYGFIYDQNTNVGYVTSNRPGGRGHEDIWQINKRYNDVALNVVAGTNPGNPAAPQAYNTQGNAKPVSATSANVDGYSHLLVTDDIGNPLANVEVDLSACGAGAGRTDGEGKYYFPTMSRTLDCSVSLRRDGFQEASIALYNFGRQNVLVAMNPDRRQVFSGMVFDARTRDPLYSAIVQYQVPGSDRVIQTSTDFDGRYSLTLEPAIAYDITYQKEGYKEITLRTVPLAGRGNKLSDVLLESNYAQYTAAGNNVIRPIEHNTPIEASASTRVIAPVGTIKSPEPVVQQIFNGYSIQLAASPEAPGTVELRQFESLSQYGNLYVKTENNIYKTRLGIYPERTEADRVLKEVIKKPQVSGAFIVEERGADEALIIGQTTRPAAYSTPSNAKGIATAIPEIVYAVQLGSFASEKAIKTSDFAAAAALGNVYSKQENGMTKVRLGVWADHTSAESAMSALKARGYKDPMVVTEKTTDPSIRAYLITESDPAPVQHSTAKTLAPKTVGKAPANPNSEANPVYDYFVQIASLSNPERFDGSGIADIGGYVEKRKAGNGLTMILLGGFSDIESVTMALNRVRARGYDEAFVVREVKGKLVRVP